MASGDRTPTDGIDLGVAALAAAYRAGAIDPAAVAEAVLARIHAHDDPAVWIDLVPAEQLRARAAALAARGPAGLPLYGVPFAVKDNIDVAGRPTTAGCPAFAYTPAEDAPAVARLIAAGAMLIGKTNLDQFATGLVGVRSPYGIPRNPVAPGCVPGGSSSGSAVAVSAGLVSFALGTDTAGSGRVPAAFNNIVGIKPTRGLVPTRGVVPACRSLDCISVFALSGADGAAVLDALAGPDDADPYSRPRPAGAPAAIPSGLSGLRFGVPAGVALTFFGDDAQAALFEAALARIRALGGIVTPVDFSPFAEAAALLYSGPFVAERYAAVGAFLESHGDDMHPVTREIIGAGGRWSATALFEAQHRLAALGAEARAVLAAVDMLVVPTAPTIYTVDEVLADPIALNGNLGAYTNFVNLLDLAAVAVPSGFTPAGRPGGITLIGPAWTDALLSTVGGVLHHAAETGAGAAHTPVPAPPPAAGKDSAGALVRLAVNGAHMAGLTLNHQLAAAGARLARRCRTAPVYRLFALDAMDPPRPGLVRADPGAAIEVEVWELPVDGFGAFVDAVPPPLAIGTVELEDGALVNGFLCESAAVAAAPDISEFGGWRSYLAAVMPPPAEAVGAP